MKKAKEKTVQGIFLRLLSLDLESRSRLPALALRQFRVTYHAGREFIQDRCLLMASSLTYTTILTVVPLMAVSLSWFSRLKLSEEEVRDFLSRYLFPNARLFNTIQENIEKFSKNTATLSTLGTIVLFIATYSMINTMEKTLNSIWHVTEKRGLWDKVSSFWLTLTLAPILIGLSLFMTARLKTLPVVGTILESPLVKASLVYIIPFLLIWFAFFMVYKLLPYTRVGTKPAMIGGMIGAAFFSFFKWGFALYITHFSTYSKIYGALAAIPAFLLYLFLVWIIVLLGAEFSYVLQYPELYRHSSSQAFRPENYRGYLALRAMGEIVRRFRKGETPARVLEISQQLGVAYEWMEQLLLQLKRSGMIQNLEGMRDAFIPARDPERIPVSQVIEMVRGKLLVVSPVPDEPEQRVISDLFQKGRIAFERELGKVSMEQLVERMYPDPSCEGSS